MKGILITGASGGFGCEFARQLEDEGHRLLLHGRDTARLKLTLGRLAHPKRHRCLQGDLSRTDGVEQLCQAIKDEELTGLVNNAGFGVWGAFERTESVPQIDVLRTDLVAPVELTHALLPHLIRNHGFIINVSSLAGETPLPHMSTYAAAKAGLTFWSEALRTELNDRVRVVTLAPGPSPTGFRDVSGMPMGKGNAFRAPADLVVRAALHTLAKGGGYCVPGFRHRMLWLLQKTIPRALALPIMERHLRP